ncbi:MAG: DUF1802 family protein [Cyanobacteria bacterium J06633_1]
MAIVNSSLKYALKEWAIAVEALTQGDTIVLLRKGGIRERGFRVEHTQAWLYPTYEHQKPNLLDPKYAASVTEVESGWHPEAVTIQSCAQITEVLPVSKLEQLAALQPYHIWNEQMISDRLKWKPQTPILVLLLRVYRLAQPQTIPFDSAYGGCKSWIALKSEISLDLLDPVLSEAEYLSQTQAIKALISAE